MNIIILVITANDIEGTTRDVRIDVENIADIGHFLQFFDHNFALFVENRHKIVENLEVERRREHFAPAKPFRTGTGEQASVEPRVQEIVLAALVNQFVAA